MSEDLFDLFIPVLGLLLVFFALYCGKNGKRIQKARDCRTQHGRISKLFFKNGTAFDRGYDFQKKMLWINSAIQDAGKDFILSKSEWENSISVDDKIKSFILGKYFNEDFLFQYDLGSYAVPKKCKKWNRTGKLYSLFSVDYEYVVFYMQAIALFSEKEEQDRFIVWGIDTSRNEEDIVLLKMFYAALYVLSIVGCREDSYIEQIERVLEDLNADREL